MFLVYSLFSLIGPLVALALVVASVHTIWRTIALPRRTKLAPACERCRYEVADLASFTCPECGGDLRRVGIITPAMEARRRGSLAGAIIAWTFLCGLVGYVAMMAAFMWTFAGRTSSTVTGWQQTLSPSSGAYSSLTVDYESDGMSIGSEIELVLTTAEGATHPLTIDPGAMRVAGVGGGASAWTPETIDAWYRQIGLDVGNPAIAAEAAEVSNYIDLLVMSPSSGFSANMLHHQIQLTATSGGAVAPSAFLARGAILLTSLGVLGLVYILGLLVIIRRRRRLVRTAAAV